MTLRTWKVITNMMVTIPKGKMVIILKGKVTTRKGNIRKVVTRANRTIRNNRIDQPMNFL